MEENGKAFEAALQSVVFPTNTHLPNTMLPSLPEGEALIENLDDQDNPEVQSKIVSLVLDLAKLYQGSYRTITMDNYYTSVKTMCELAHMGLLGRGMTKMNRKFLCQYVKFILAKNEI